MCQAKRPASPQRPRKTAAEAQAEAIADVERIAQELQATQSRFHEAIWLTWESLDPRVQDACRAVVRDLLQRDVIRVGQRPVVEEQTPGQISIEDLERAAIKSTFGVKFCEHVWAVGQDFCVKGCGTSYEQLYRRHNSEL